MASKKSIIEDLTKKGSQQINQILKSEAKSKKKPIISPPQDQLVRSGVEIYKTKDKNIENTSNEEKEGFVLQNGQITEIAYYDDLVSTNFEQDYEDISTNGSVSFVSVDDTRFYKGKKILLKKAYNPKKWNELENCLMGFITEQTYSENGVDIKISGMSKLLDQEKQFTYKNTKISKILKDMIESAGLKANIDTAGLDDKKVDYTNVSSSSNNGDASGTGSATIDEAVQKAIEGKTDDLSKAKAIDSAFKSHVIYDYYFDVRYPDLDKAWKHAHLNCADGANVLCAMFRSADLNAVIHHTPGEDGKGHYIVIVTINGKQYPTDNAANSGNHTSRAFGSVWGPSSGSKVGTKI